MPLGEILTDLYNRRLGLDHYGNLILSTGGGIAVGDPPVLLDLSLLSMLSGHVSVVDNVLSLISDDRTFIFDEQPVTERAPVAGPRIWTGAVTGSTIGPYLYVRGTDSVDGNAGGIYGLGGNATGLGEGGPGFLLAGSSLHGPGGRAEVNAGDNDSADNDGGMLKLAAGQGLRPGDVWIRAGIAADPDNDPSGAIVLRGPNIMYFQRNLNGVDYDVTGTILAKWITEGFGIDSTPADGTIAVLTLPSGTDLNSRFPTRANHDHGLEVNNAFRFPVINSSIDWTSSVELVAPTVAFVGDTHASTLIDNIADTSGLTVGHFVIGAGSGTGNKIVSKTANSITTSSALAGSATSVPFTSTDILTQGSMTVSPGQSAEFYAQKLANAPDTTWRVVRLGGSQRYGIREDRTAGVRWAVSNFSNNANALAALDVQNSTGAGTGIFSLLLTGTGYVNAAPYLAADTAVLLASAGTQGLNLVSLGGDIKFWTSTGGDLAATFEENTQRLTLEEYLVFAAGLPSSDPGIPGHLYRTVGAVMISL